MPPKRKKLEPRTPLYILDDATRQSILEASYIGKKGYTVPKSVLPEKELEFLKKDLFLKPQVPGPAFAQAQGDSAFPVYRENPNKIYIPRFLRDRTIWNTRAKRYRGRRRYSGFIS